MLGVLYPVACLARALPCFETAQKASLDPLKIAAAATFELQQGSGESSVAHVMCETCRVQRDSSNGL